jgi:tetratricopeptide (TPR) repeat protein
MKILLEDSRTRWSFCIVVLLIALSLAYSAAKVWLAAQWGASWDPNRMARAAYLEPANAVYWYRLGLYEKWNFEQRDLRRAVAYYQRATEANPRSDTYWMDLADAYEAIGQPERARDAFEKARTAHPISSDVAWRYGNFLLRVRDYPEAFTQLRRALIGDPGLTFQAISECSKVSGDLPTVLNEVLPSQNRYYLIALDYFLSQHQLDAAVTVGNRLLTLRPSAEMAQFVPLINGLIAQERVDEALRIWRQALEVTNWPHDPSSNSSVVFNGGFEHDILNGAFDWQEDPISGAAFGLDDDVTHTGARALRIMFDGTANLDFQNLRQLCSVQPGRHYHFAAFVRLEGISTDSGIRFAIYDTFHPASLQILTPDLVGSHAWSPMETDLVTGPETHLLTIALRRLPSWKFDNKLRGTVWVDDVSLIPFPGDFKESRR